MKYKIKTKSWNIIRMEYKWFPEITDKTIGRRLYNSYYQTIIVLCFALLHINKICLFNQNATWKDYKLNYNWSDLTNTEKQKRGELVKYMRSTVGKSGE